MIAPTPTLADSLRPIVQQVVEQALELEADLRRREGPSGPKRLAYSEAEAAELLGIESHQLRDARQKRGELKGSLVGKGFVYEHAELLRWLASRRCRTVADLKRQLAKK